MPDDKVLERVARRIRELRARSGLSLQQLAEKTGLPAKTIGRIELCRASPTLRTLAQIADGLGVDVVVFFWTDELPNTPLTTPTKVEPLLRLVAGRSPEDIDWATRLLKAAFDS